MCQTCGCTSCGFSNLEGEKKLFEFSPGIPDSSFSRLEGVGEKKLFSFNPGMPDGSFSRLEGTIQPIQPKTISLTTPEIKLPSVTVQPNTTTAIPAKESNFSKVLGFLGDTVKSVTGTGAAPTSETNDTPPPTESKGIPATVWVIGGVLLLLIGVYAYKKTRK